MPYRDPRQKAVCNQRYKQEHRDELRVYHQKYMHKYRLQMDEAQKAQIREANRLRKIERRKEMAILILTERNRPCVDCGVALPPECMEFDHIRGTKLFNVGQWENARLGTVNRKQAVLDEIAKCVVRCPNCHRLRHFNERT